MKSSPPNEALQRSGLRSVLNRKALAVREALHGCNRRPADLWLIALAFTYFGLSGCRSATAALSGKSMTDALNCRGQATFREPGKELRSVHGKTATPDGGPIPGVSVILVGKERPGEVFRAMSDNVGHFAFDGIPTGSYTLKTCLEGFDTVEVPLTVSRSGVSEPLVLAIRLSK